MASTPVGIKLLGQDALVRRVAAMDGEFVATVCIDGVVRVNHIATGELLKVFAGDTSPRPTVTSFAVLDETLLAAGFDNGMFMVWDSVDHRTLHLGTVSNPVMGIAALGTNRVVLAVKKFILVYAREGGRIEFNWSDYPLEHASRILHIASHGSRVAAACENRTTTIWGRVSNRFCWLTTLIGHTSDIMCVVMNTRYIAIGSRDGNIIVYNASTFRLLRRLHAHDQEVSSVSLMDNMTLSSSVDQTVRLTRLHDGESVSRVDFQFPVTSCMLTEDRRIVAAGGAVGPDGHSAGRAVVVSLPPVGTHATYNFRF